ncbi:MAG: glycerate kinase, partial [Rhodospirillales bacterium]|nr:glycerate kinase [Rhodospirillales bacterium]
PEPDRDPTLTSTFGTGELIRASLDAGARQILLGIGGSATTDGACGAAQALGVRFVDEADSDVSEGPITGGMLQRIARIDTGGLDARLDEAELLIACDVTNPMTGPNGAAYVYGPQKGATPQQVNSLDDSLRHLAELFRRNLSVDVEQKPGAGAAGAFGGGAMAMLGGKLQSGIELVLEATGFDKRVASCDLCLTGEGKLDGQSASGKAVMGVVKAARRHGVPVVALAGCIGEDVERLVEVGLSGYECIGPDLPRDESIARAAELIERAAQRVARSRIQDQ